MKKLICILLAAATTAGCEKDDPTRYDMSQGRVCFPGAAPNETAEYPGYSNSDSTFYASMTFKQQPEGVAEAVIEVPVKLIGGASGSDRKIGVRVLEEGTTAQPGQYEILGAEVPAGKTYGAIRMKKLDLSNWTLINFFGTQDYQYLTSRGTYKVRKGSISGLFANEATLGGIKMSFVLSILAAALACLIVVIACNYIFKNRSKKSGVVLEYCLLFPWLLPTILICYSYRTYFNAENIWYVGNVNLYFAEHVRILLVLAYTVVKLPFSLRMIKAAFYAIDEELEDAARNMGASGLTTFLRVKLPIILPSVLAVFALLGARKGLIRSLMALVSVVVALIGATLLTAMFVEPVTDLVYPKVEERVLEQFERDIPSDALAAEDGDLSAGGLLPDELSDLLAEALDTLKRFGVSDDAIDGVTKSVTDSAVSAAERAAYLLVKTIVQAALFLAFFLALMLLLRLLTHGLDRLFSLPVLAQLNGLGGAALSLMEGALLIFLIVFLAPRLGVTWFADHAAGTHLLAWFLNNTPRSIIASLT